MAPSCISQIWMRQHANILAHLHEYEAVNKVYVSVRVSSSQKRIIRLATRWSLHISSKSQPPQQAPDGVRPEASPQLYPESLAWRHDDVQVMTSAVGPADVNVDWSTVDIDQSTSHRALHVSMWAQAISGLWALLVCGLGAVWFGPLGFNRPWAKPNRRRSPRDPLWQRHNPMRPASVRPIVCGMGVCSCRSACQAFGEMPRRPGRTPAYAGVRVCVRVSCGCACGLARGVMCAGLCEAKAWPWPSSRPNSLLSFPLHAGPSSFSWPSAPPLSFSLPSWPSSPPSLRPNSAQRPSSRFSPSATNQRALGLRLESDAPPPHLLGVCTMIVLAKRPYKTRASSPYRLTLALPFPQHSAAANRAR
nr:unnamed protein product [Digitaria exilis]